jgi:hypothetical protein
MVTRKFQTGTSEDMSTKEVFKMTPRKFWVIFATIHDLNWISCLSYIRVKQPTEDSDFVSDIWSCNVLGIFVGHLFGWKHTPSIERVNHHEEVRPPDTQK